MLRIAVFLVWMTLSSASLVTDNLVEVEDEQRLLGVVPDDNSAQQKAITYKSAGDYTLVSIPWNGATSLNFNDTTAATLSTLGNAALLVGGLYLLSGFPTALARSDPFGISRRFGAPAPPPKFYKPQPQKTETKKKYQRRPSVRPIERRGPAERFAVAEERQLPLSLPSFKPFKSANTKRPVKKVHEKQAEERQQFPRLPQIQRPNFNIRPLNFRMPQLPQLRLPTLPGLRRPAPRPVGGAPRPSTAGNQADPAPAPAAPVFRPQTAAPAPAVRPTARPVRPVSSRPVSPIIPAVRPVEPQVAPVRPATAAPVTGLNFGSSPFESDPFSEFQSADFGNEESFRDLIAAQFGDSFDLKRLPETK